MPLSAVLGEMSWLRHLPEELKVQVLANAHEGYFRPGEFVVQRGDTASAWLGVASGLLKVCTTHQNGRIVTFSPLLEGSWIGEATLASGEPFSFDIVAMRPSRVIYVSCETFRWLLDSSLDFNHSLIKGLSERLLASLAMTQVSRLTDSVARVAQSIGIVFKTVQQPRQSKLLALSQTELAELIGLSRQSISIALKQLEGEGLLRPEYGGVWINDLYGLIGYRERG